MPRRAQRKRRRAHLSPLTVIGELLLIGGLATLGYLVWQPWYTTTVVAGQNAAIADELSAKWRAHPTPPPADPGVIPITAVPAEGDVFGVLRVPASSWLHVKACMPPCVCVPVKCAACRPSAAPPLAKLATTSTRWRSWVKQVQHAGAASSRPCVVPP